jgi:hypothetical protein
MISGSRAAGKRVFFRRIPSFWHLVSSHIVEDLNLDLHESRSGLDAYIFFIIDN